MPLGETIGSAYIRILADGSAFADDARRQIKEDEGVYKQAGRTSGKAFEEGRREVLDKETKKTRKQAEDDVRKSLGRLKAQGELSGGAYMKGVQDILEKKFPKGIGAEMFRQLNKEFAAGRLDVSGVSKSLEDLRPLIAKATANIQADEKKVAQKILADEEKLARDIVAIRGRTAAALAKARADEEKLGREILAIQGRTDKAAAEQLKSLSKMFDNAAESAKRFGAGLDKSGNSRKSLRDDLMRIRAVLPNVVTDTEAFRRKWDEAGKALRGASPFFTKIKTRLDEVGGSIAKAFGKGSRNNFLNFFGGFMAIVPSLVSGLASVGGWVSGLANTFSDLQQTAGGGIKGAVSAIGGLLQAGLPGLVAAIAAVVIGLETLGVSLGIFGAAAVAVTGMVLALAGSIAFALAGAIGVVAGALVPFAAAVGVAAIAMAGMDKKSKIFKDLKKTWKDFQKTAQTAIFGKNLKGLEGISDVLKALKPLVKGVGGALGDMLDQLAKAAEGKAFKTWIGQVTALIPAMVTQIGSIAGHLGTFLGEAFIAAAPYIKEFLGWLDKVTGKLEATGKVAKGKKTSPLTDFFTGAVASAKIIWGLIKNIGTAIGILFGKGKKTGDSIFQSLSDQVGHLVAWLKDPKNKKTIDDFFATAKEVAGHLGDAVLAVITTIGKLNTGSSKTALLFVIDSFTKIVGWIGDGATALDTFNGKVVETGIKMQSNMDQLNKEPAGKRILQGGPIEAIQIAYEKLSKINWQTFGGKDGWEVLGHGLHAVGEGFKSLGGPGSGIELLRTNLGKLGTDIGTKVSGWGSIISKGWTNAWSNFHPIKGLEQFFTSFGEMLGKGINGAFHTFDISDIFQKLIQPFIDAYNYLVGHSLIPDLVDAIVRIFSTLPGRIVGALGNLGSQFASWVATLPGKARVAAGQVITAFSGLAGRVIAKAGSIASSFASWVASLGGKARSAATGVISAFSGLARKMIAKAGSIASALGSWMASLPGKARTVANNIASAFSGLAGKAVGKMGDFGSKLAAWGRSAVTKAAGIARDIVSAFKGLAGKIVDAIGTIIPKIKMPSIKAPVVNAIVKVKDKLTATGGVFDGPQFRMIGEAGPEAVVPLRRPLTQVDPAVRALSAFAQGLRPAPQSDGGRAGRSIDVGGITVITPSKNPRAVAAEVVAQMAGASYL